MSDEYQRTDRHREAGSIGIGAMIVFIALILVAAVASTIIIKTAEELQQNAEATSDDTRKEISGKISIIQILVNGSDGTDIDSLIVTAKVASGSMNVLVNTINWLITCGTGTTTGTYGLASGNLGTTSPWGEPILGADTDAAGNAGTATDDTWEKPNAETLAGLAYAASDELTAGTVFKFDIDLDRSNVELAGGGACDEMAGVNEQIQLKMIVSEGGTTISQLDIDNITPGKEVI